MRVLSLATARPLVGMFRETCKGVSCHLDNLLSMAVALAAFFAVMLWLDPKRRQYAAATAVAIGAVGLADSVPTVGGSALAQETDPPPELTVHGDMPDNCERRSDGQIYCDDMPLYEWCTGLVPQALAKTCAWRLRRRQFGRQ